MFRKSPLACILLVTILYVHFNKLHIALKINCPYENLNLELWDLDQRRRSQWIRWSLPGCSTQWFPCKKLPIVRINKFQCHGTLPAQDSLPLFLSPRVMFTSMISPSPMPQLPWLWSFPHKCFFTLEQSKYQLSQIYCFIQSITGFSWEDKNDHLYFFYSSINKT